MTAAVALKTEPANWASDAKQAFHAVEGLYQEALGSVRARVSREGKIINDLLEADQHRSEEHTSELQSH
mgnify:CR=1 FL=1